MESQLNNELEATADENGQVTFAAAVYFSDEMSVETKMKWLKDIAYGSQDTAVRADAAMYLKRLTTPLESEFNRTVETRQTF